MRPHKDRPDIGDIFTTRQGYDIEILEYQSYNKILVKFLDKEGHKKYISKRELLNGQVKNPFHSDIMGVGFLGVGPHTVKCQPGSSTKSKEYSHWHNMLTRCYYQPYQDRFPTYLECSVDLQWYNFQEFAEWCQWQEGFKYPKSVLDKDLLVPGNKIYSAENCVFLPAELNGLIVSLKKSGKQYPTGISYQKDYDKYIVSCAVNGKNKNLGRYKRPEEAFSVYKDFKENLVRGKAEEYKSVIDIRAYTALLNFEVKEI